MKMIMQIYNGTTRERIEKRIFFSSLLMCQTILKGRFSMFNFIKKVGKTLSDVDLKIRSKKYFKKSKQLVQAQFRSDNIDIGPV